MRFGKQLDGLMHDVTCLKELLGNLEVRVGGIESEFGE